MFLCFKGIKVRLVECLEATGKLEVIRFYGFGEIAGGYSGTEA